MSKSRESKQNKRHTKLFFFTMDLDPLTADHPDRTAREDEEAAAEACERELGRAPVLLVREGKERCLHLPVF